MCEREVEQVLASLGANRRVNETVLLVTVDRLPVLEVKLSLSLTLSH